MYDGEIRYSILLLSGMTETKSLFFLLFCFKGEQLEENYEMLKKFWKFNFGQINFPINVSDISANILGEYNTPSS